MNLKESQRWVHSFQKFFPFHRCHQRSRFFTSMAQFPHQRFEMNEKKAANVTFSCAQTNVLSSVSRPKSDVARDIVGATYIFSVGDRPHRQRGHGPISGISRRPIAAQEERFFFICFFFPGLCLEDEGPCVQGRNAPECIP